MSKFIKWLAGSALIGACLLASALLVVQHFGSLNLPGCGPQSDCARAASSRWGSTAGWPVSFFGLAYSVSIAVVWVAMARQGVPASLRYAVRPAALVSIGFLIIMWLGPYSCVYCLTVHVSNLAFWLLTERTTHDAGPFMKPAIAMLAGFALVSALLSVALSEQKRTVQEHARQELDESIKQIRAQQRRDANRSSAGGSSPSTGTLETDQSSAANLAQNSAGAAPAAAIAASVGVSTKEHKQLRFPLGPDDAQVQLVVYQDYQCQFCQQIDRDIQTLLRQYGDSMSVAVRHFPLCVDCNFALNVTVHANACRAAKAAEAAGILQGSEGFWRMHRWLFKRGGTFTDQELLRGVKELGYEDIDLFLATMEGKQVTAAILADILEGQTLAIEGTPTVILNRVMLSGLHAENAIALAVVAATEAPDVESHEVAEQVTAASPSFEQAFVEGLEERLQRAALLSTVRISDGDRRGSGVVVGVRKPFAYVLTANHVIAQATSVRVEWFVVETYPQISGENSAAAVVAQSDVDDLAVLRFSLQDSAPHWLPLAGKDHEPTGSSSFAALTVGCTGGEPPTCRAVNVVGRQRIRRTPDSTAAAVWEVNEPSEHGRSGGPLVHLDGFVLGIASGMSDGNSYFCDWQAVARLLSESGLGWLRAADSDMNSSDAHD